MSIYIASRCWLTAKETSNCWGIYCNKKMSYFRDYWVLIYILYSINYNLIYTLKKLAVIDRKIWCLKESSVYVYMYYICILQARYIAGTSENVCQWNEYMTGFMKTVNNFAPNHLLNALWFHNSWRQPPSLAKEKKTEKEKQ